jgi:hypothetical protein
MYFTEHSAACDAIKIPTSEIKPRKLMNAQNVWVPGIDLRKQYPTTKTLYGQTPCVKNQVATLA